MKERLKVAIEKYFRPEFLNRLDDVIVFHSLNKENLKQIVDIELSKVRGRLADRGLELVLTDEAKEFLIDKGYNPDYGARPLRRAIENLIEDPLAEEILRGTFKGKDTITVIIEQTRRSPADQVRRHHQERGQGPGGRRRSTRAPRRGQEVTPCESNLSRSCGTRDGLGISRGHPAFVFDGLPCRCAGYVQRIAPACRRSRIPASHARNDPRPGARDSRRASPGRPPG